MKGDEQEAVSSPVTINGYLQTGQRTCHDTGGGEIPCAGSGQDAEFQRGLPWPHPRFRPESDIVADTLTGLVWTRDAGLSEFPLIWSEALAFIKQMNREHRFDFNDWRLPNRRELRSLINHQARRPALPEGHPFINVFPGWYWTSTTAAIAPAHAWYVNMDGGRMFYGGKDQSFMVWPVRGDSHVLPATGQCRCYGVDGGEVTCDHTGQDGETRMGIAWPKPRFTEQGNAALDRLTGLLWRRTTDIAEGPVNWEGALAVVGRLSNKASGTIWRLPNINELESLVDADAHGPALPNGHPFVSVRDIYWSSTTSLYEPDWAWALYLDKGAVGVGKKSFARFHVWPVADQHEV